MSENTRKTETKPDFILTKGGVMIIGSELIGEKMTAIICEVLAADHIFEPTDLTTIVLRNDGYPIDVDTTQVFGMAFADTHSISINLEQCWGSACKTAAKDDKKLSFMGILWINVLQSLGHEMDHLALATADREIYEAMRRDEEGVVELEKSGTESATSMIIQMAKKFDIEMPAPSEMGWLGTKWMELHTTDTTKDLKWVIKARKMVEEGIVYTEPENDISISTFREFVKLAHDANCKDGLWEQATTPVDLIAHLDNGVVEVIKAEPVQEVRVDTVTPEDEKVETITVELPAGDGVMQMAAAATFIAAADAADEDMVDDVPFDGATRMTDGVDSEGQPTIVMETAVEGVPLPEPIAQQQAAVAAAATTAVPPTQPAATTYTPNNLPPEVMAQTMRSVYLSLYAHLFTKCGWRQNPQTGRFFFANPGAVLEGVNIQHILTQMGAANFIMEYDTLNAAGQFAAETCQGMIRGYLTSKQGLPAYSIYLNIGGRRIKRSFLPQNPEKRNAQSAYTKSADEAGQGHVIAWVFKDEAADNAPFKEKCAVKIYDNIYEAF